MTLMAMTTRMCLETLMCVNQYLKLTALQFVAVDRGQTLQDPFTSVRGPHSSRNSGGIQRGDPDNAQRGDCLLPRRRMEDRDSDFQCFVLRLYSEDLRSIEKFRRICERSM